MWWSSPSGPPGATITPCFRSCVRQLVAAEVAHADPEEVRLAVGHVHAELAQLVDQHLALPGHRVAAALDLGVAVSKRVLHRRLGHGVHAEHGGHGGQEVGVGGDRVAGAQAREAVDLRERPHHEQARKLVDQPQAGVDLLGALEVDERLVQEHVQVLRKRGEELAQLRRAAVRARRVVRVAEDERARAVRDRGRHVSVLDGHRRGTGVGGEERVERVRRPLHHQLVATREQCQRGGVQQIGRAVAQDDPVGIHAVALREQAPHGGRVPVRVAVHAPARASDRGIDDLGVRQVGPFGARQVDIRRALERRRPLAAPALAPLEVQLGLVDVVELPVVVAEAHARSRARVWAPVPGSRRTRP